eukprot:153501-Chlamydomonas_euryale.AAC.1
MVRRMFSAVKESNLQVLAPGACLAYWWGLATFLKQDNVYSLVGVGRFVWGCVRHAWVWVRTGEAWRHSLNRTA